MKHTILTVMLTVIAMVGHARQVEGNQMLPAYWSDNKGNWTIAFLEKGAIYDSKLWTYKQRNINVDTGEAEMIVTDGGQEIKIIVGKEKKGRRNMKIGKQKLSCSMISPQFISEFPTKDNPDRFHVENDRH